MCELRPRLLFADDHPLLLEGLRKRLEPSFEVVGTASDGGSLLEAAQSLQPDLIITDITMPGIDGIGAIRRLRTLVSKSRLLVLSVHVEPSWVRAAFEAGAHGYVTKISAPEEIETAVREVLKGNFFVSPVVAGALLGFTKEDHAVAARTRPAGGEMLTPRELDILRLVGKGLPNKDIARELGVSVTTVRTHLSNVYEKLEPGSRVELALYAAQAQEAVM